MSDYRRGYLVLEDGERFHGTLFGSCEVCEGEVVFNTGMVGYVEALTDPSYAGQILTFTYPLMGNYGVPPKNRWESDGIKARGVVVSGHTPHHSHWESERSLDDWLKESDICGISGIDTRELTKHLRSRGTMLGRIVPEGEKPTSRIEDPNEMDLVSGVSPREVTTHEGGGPRIMVVNCGMKRSIERSLISRNCTVIRVPHDHPLTGIEYDAIMISNGPGNPERCQETIGNIRKIMQGNDPPPIAGICLGNQIMALAAGASTYKMKFGHRSQNQPCREEGTQRCIITSQNHGYAVDEKTLNKEWEVHFRNLNDNTVEGIRHRELPFMAVQFHPEANPGPTDPEGFFDNFLEVIGNGN